ncbi:MAG: 2'-5' RNA ligase family protein [Sedimentisphaerales bacterium]|jgi:2'-5' RNA ligase|nr:2'-5' RNA ligase family protein [Sedimentisphaerales bacterium]HNY78826.1 2'-5' RNA ligase family protein [Sedimentisphaerales bacterium]HOC62984.1 2'-5' RNA ligase family protein [Sedimentisphaerales bacterium]HOH64799.1 2'-5' RNA ligase family protein [Sedimentisphaerales bacterium]HPY52070.1 2'-5' RNA ligase family protein [Sedimentisphaerales bacterium]
MSQIAVDIVLLPEARIARLAVETNRRLTGSSCREIVLDETTCLPHISLAMGCIESEQVDAIGKMLGAVAKACPVGKLAITGVVTVLNTRNEPNSLFAVAKTEALQTLHEQIVETIEPHASHDVTAEMICGDEEVAPSTLAWIRDFRRKAAFAVFFPHITIGYGVVTEPMTFPMDFVAPQLALCHLGNHCTCRKVLASASTIDQ